MSQTIYLASGNAHKLHELQTALDSAGLTVQVLGPDKIGGMPDVEETGSTFEANSLLKAHGLQEVGPADGWYLADDSGIEIDALHGAPGVYTADWAETPSGRDFEMAMRKTHEKLEAIDAPQPRLAAFFCTMVLAWPDGHDEVFEGRMPGQVVWPMRGQLGHGYDPIFQPDGYDVMFGEMDRWEKNKISHRARAIEKLVRIFEDKG